MREQITDRTRLSFYNQAFETEAERTLANLNPEAYED